LIGGRQVDKIKVGFKQELKQCQWKSVPLKMTVTVPYMFAIGILSRLLVYLINLHKLR